MATPVKCSPLSLLLVPESFGKNPLGKQLGNRVFISCLQMVTLPVVFLSSLGSGNPPWESHRVTMP